MNQKLKKLQNILHSYKKVLIAFSGGVDSTFLLKVACDTLGKENVYAVTRESEFFTDEEKKRARKLARSFGVSQIIIKASVLKNKALCTNPRNRCYICKNILFAEMKKIARRLSVRVICDAENNDDIAMHRPGGRAAREAHIKRPLAEARLSKKDIRRLSHALRLPTWNLPSAACLATRVPYGVTMTPKMLARIEKSERLLEKMGFSPARVRMIDDGARIEIQKKDFKKICAEKNRNRCVQAIKKQGFKYVTLDLKGYRSGSMDEVPYR